MHPFISAPTTNHPAVQNLRERLLAFYSGETAYFTDAASGWHELFEPVLAELLERKKRIRILELGAGRATFHKYIQGRREQIEYHVQDITRRNFEYLKQIADFVYMSDIAEFREVPPYDLVFSTFVLEHVASPTDFLSDVDRLVAPQGYHIVICPRYDMPGYLCPSLRHKSLFQKIILSGWLIGSRVISWIDGRPRFWINTDPAVFHQAWVRDADAVHLVSKMDICRWHEKRSYETRFLKLPVSCGFKDFIVKNYLIIACAFRKK